jgi:HK97 family phage portal protein
MQEVIDSGRKDYRRFDEANRWGGVSTAKNSDNSITTSEDLRAWIDIIARTAAGIHVTPKEAMKCAPVKVSIKVLSESVAQLPFSIIREQNDGQREVARMHPVHKLLSSRGRPNGWQSSFEFRRLMTRWVAHRGNAFALKQTVGNRVSALIPLHPDKVRVEQGSDWSLIYRVSRKDGSEMLLDQRDVFHLRGDSDDGLIGDDPIKECADTIALALAQERFAAFMFSNGINHSGTLEVPKHLKDESYKRLKESFEEQYSGIDKSHKVIILEEGAKFNKSSMSFEEAQLLDSRKLQRSILASLWRIPPHMIGDLEKATFSNIENLARQFVDYALMPWIDLWQQAIHTQLIIPESGSELSPKFNVNGLLRGDAKTRAEFYRTMREIGGLNPNEIREKEDLPPRTDEGGDQYALPANMQVQNNQTSGDEGDDPDNAADDE